MEFKGLNCTGDYSVYIYLERGSVTNSVNSLGRLIAQRPQGSSVTNSVNSLERLIAQRPHKKFCDKQSKLFRTSIAQRPL